MDRAQVILIIDDNPDDRLLCKRALAGRPEGAPVFEEAAGGDSGLDSIASHYPDCVLLDYSLPGHNGIEVLKRIRGLYPHLPVIMLTGQGSEVVAVQSMKEGAQDYVVKATLSTELLARAVRTSIAHCALEQRIDEQRDALEIFTRALAHDLREPVRTIRSFVDLMAADKDSPEKTETYFGFVSDAADRMAMLIDTVFLYTQLDGPRATGAALCDTDQALAEVCENLRLLITERRATITHEALPTVMAHHAQMIQVLQNFCVNAVRHSPHPVAIHVRAVAQGPNWLFSVADTGPGIPAGFNEKIFAPFKRLASNEEGAGLGLAICRKIVELNGGKVWCESTPGAGATFFFTWPRETTAQVRPEAQPSPQPGPATAPPRLATLLVVDDRRADVELTRLMLADVAKLRCNLRVAFDGREALAILQAELAGSNLIDVMLLDINMPVMDGFELLERMNQDQSLKQTSVVMCSGSTYDRDMDRARDLGAIGYVVKPPWFDKLLPILQAAPNVRLERDGAGYVLLRAA